MAISGIYHQPAADSLRSAYRPTLVSVISTINDTRDDLIYCDVYINNTYYRSLNSTTPAFQTYVPFGGAGWVKIYQFDLQTIFQEYLAYMMPNVGFMPDVITDSQVTNPDIAGPTCYLNCYCMFRGSVYVGGTLVTQGYPPVQGTMETQPSPGVGQATSNPFYVLNATVQHEDIDITTLPNADVTFEKFLASKCRRYYINVNNRIYTLQTNQKQRVYIDDVNFYAVLIAHNGFATSASTRYCQRRVILYFGNGSSTVYNIGAQALYAHNSVYYIPSGVPNLKLGGGATIPFKTCVYYQVALWDLANAKYVSVSPDYYISPNRNREKKRLWFLNKFGVMQSITFECGGEEVQVSSGIKTTPYPVMFQNDVWRKEYTSQMRYNVKSNEHGFAYGTFYEDEMPYIKELFDTTVAFIELYQDMSIAAIPIVIKDANQAIRKMDERYIYEVTVEYEMSNANNVRY